MKYEIAYIFGDRYEGYRVTLIFGRTSYIGRTVYKTWQAAVAAAKRTGATPVEDRT